MAKIAIIEHMTDGHNDRVRRYFSQQGHELCLFNPAHGNPLRGEILDYDASVVYGGVQSVNDSSLDFVAIEVDWLRQCINANRPVLGICLGAQLLTLASGGTVQPHADGLHEIGFTRINPIGAGETIFSDNATFYQWHNEGCSPGSGVEMLATGDVFDCQAFRIGQRQYGVQFHPEAAGHAIQGWWDNEPDMENLPGCHPLTRQRSDAARFDPAIDDWVEGFLSRWQGAW